MGQTPSTVQAPLSYIAISYEIKELGKLGIIQIE